MIKAKPTILLVEDDIWLAQLYSDALENDGFTVTIAATAESALQSIDTVLPGMIILDMFLPSHNGIELLHEIASYPDTNAIPVMVLSNAFKQDFGMSDLRWREYGVVEYLYKPVTKPAALVAGVKQQLLTQGSPT